MRCPDCSKFVGMENGDPEIDLSAEYSDGQISITGNVRHTRNCADCGTELKSIDHYPDETISLEDFPEWKELTDTEKATIKEEFANGADVEIDAGDGDVSESGGGRYAKNLITIEVSYTLTILLPCEVTKKFQNLTYSGTLSLESAASEYEECC